MNCSYFLFFKFQKDLLPGDDITDEIERNCQDDRSKNIQNGMLFNKNSR